MPSTAINDFNYDPHTSRLVIEFNSGLRYAYFGVPREVYMAMQDARSRGTYFNTWIRDRYSYSRLDVHSAA